MKFNTLLIANRGEIACRIIESAKHLGLKTVVVYSAADRHSLPVQLADESVYIGPSPARQSYLNIDAVIEAAQKTGAEAVHPGYGFLSENAHFARACHQAKLIFVGPPPEAIELMADKMQAKMVVQQAGIPCISGYQGEDQSEEVLLEQAEKIGFPLMIKAASGGGGYGMARVQKASELSRLIGQVQSEAESVFGSDRLILERAIEQARHIEVQICADGHGQIVHLGERDCSSQRRFQKVVEEAPAPALTEALRESLTQAAVKAARAVNYVGVGTVEFLLDQAGRFYFLEMNTRLQVEHRITEAVTGLDLVALQIRLADHQPLAFEQSAVETRGHAIEARLYAENPARGFLPNAGFVSLWHPPQGPFIQLDTAIHSGAEVSGFYDPLLAKVIAYGENREEARHRLLEALGSTALFGLETNRNFLISVLQHPEFIAGDIHTGWLAKLCRSDGSFPSAQVEVSDLALAAVLRYRVMNKASENGALSWTEQLPGSSLSFKLRVEAAAQGYQVKVGLIEFEVELIKFTPPVAELMISNHRHLVIFGQDSEQKLLLATENNSFALVLASRED